MNVTGRITDQPKGLSKGMLTTDATLVQCGKKSEMVKPFR